MKDSRKKTTNKKAGQYVERREPFNANNLDAVWASDRWYIVFSWGWYPIFAYDKLNDTWLENSSKYSKSTAKQMGQVRPWHSRITAVDLNTYRPWAFTAQRYMPEKAVA